MSKTKRAPKIRYGFRAGSRHRVKAQEAGEELARIASRAGGELRPAAVVDEARPEDSPLHPEFEWNDEIAAELHREAQARDLIRSVRIVEAASDGTTEPQSSIAYVAVVTDPEQSRAYLSTAHVMADQDLRKQAIGDALGLLKGVRRRYGQFLELQNVWKAIDEAEASAE